MGGSSGGGSSSGAIDYPAYMKDFHRDVLEEMHWMLPLPNPYEDAPVPGIAPVEVDGPVILDKYTNYIVARRQEAWNIPFDFGADFSLHQPGNYGQVLTLLCWLLSHLGQEYDIPVPSQLLDVYEELRDHANTLQMTPNLHDEVEFETSIKPSFLAGMRDINAVQSSTFIVGLSILHGVYAAKAAEWRHKLLESVKAMQVDLAKTHSTLTADIGKANIERLMKVFEISSSIIQTATSSSGNIDDNTTKVSLALKTLNAELLKLRESVLMHLDGNVDALLGKNIEVGRLRVVAGFEQSTLRQDYMEKRYRWNIENYQHIANMLAAIGGGTAMSGKVPSRFQSALGGALSGAAAGAMMASGTAVGGPVGALIGGVLGVGASLL